MSKPRNPNGVGSYKLRKDGRYQWTQKIDGKARYIYAKSLKELQEKVNKVANLQITNSKLSVAEWFEKWLAIYVEPLKKEATYNQYKIIYEQHIKGEIGYRKISNITRSDIQKVIAEMNKKGLSTWTMKHARKIMNIAFEKAYDEKIISVNPVKKIEIPNKQAKPRKTITASELKTLFENLKSTRWYWAFNFMLVTGLRRGELLALKWSDIDYENRRIIIDESNSSTGLGDTKSSKVHYVPLSNKAIYYLKKQKEMLQHEFNPILYNPNLQKLDLVFPSKQGTLMKPDSLNSVLDRINKKTGLHITPHMFRHTFVYMAKGKMTLSEIQEALGHDESTTTLDIYGTMLSDTQTVASKIDDAFKMLDEEIEKIEKAERKKSEATVISLADYRRVNKN